MAVAKSRLRVAGQHAKVSNHALDTLPAVIQEFVTGLPVLLGEYYKWADLPGNYQSESKRLLDYMNANTSSDEVFSYIKNVYMRAFPLSSSSDIRFLMRFAKTFYSQRGTEESLKFLFKALYNDKIKVDYPSQYIFTTSDAEWSNPIQMRLLYIDSLEFARGTRIWGVSSGASAILDEFSMLAVGDDILAECSIREVLGTFWVDEPIRITVDDVNYYSRTYPTVAVTNIVNPGLGYKEDTLLKLVYDGDGNGFYSRISSVGPAGEILEVDVISHGTGYVYSPPVLYLDDPDLFDDALLVHETASITVELVANHVSPGKYISRKSMVSDVYKLHDGDYYQNYSYVIKTNVPTNEFSSTVKALAHPAGTKMFTLSSIDTGHGAFSNQSGHMLYHLSHPEDQNYRNNNTDSHRKFNDVTVNITSSLFLPHYNTGKIVDDFSGETYPLLSWYGMNMKLVNNKSISIDRHVYSEHTYFDKELVLSNPMFHIDLSVFNQLPMYSTAYTTNVIAIDTYSMNRASLIDNRGKVVVSSFDYKKFTSKLMSGTTSGTVDLRIVNIPLIGYGLESIAKKQVIINKSKQYITSNEVDTNQVYTIKNNSIVDANGVVVDKADIEVSYQNVENIQVSYRPGAWYKKHFASVDTITNSKFTSNIDINTKVDLDYIVRPLSYTDVISKVHNTINKAVSTPIELKSFSVYFTELPKHSSKMIWSIKNKVNSIVSFSNPHQVINTNHIELNKYTTSAPTFIDYKRSTSEYLFNLIGTELGDFSDDPMHYYMYGNTPPIISYADVTLEQL